MCLLKYSDLKIDDPLLLPKINNNKQLNTFSQGRIITDYNKIFPSKSNKVICYDNEGFNLLEPRNTFIRKGMKTKFKFRIKGAHSVYLLDGNKLTPFKKIEENTFGGQKEIKTDNVSICCLKNKNIFTEVFRFKTRKEMILSKSLGLTYRNKKNNNNEESIKSNNNKENE